MFFIIEEYTGININSGIGISLIKSNSSPPSPQPTIPIEINPLDQ